MIIDLRFTTPVAEKKKMEKIARENGLQLELIGEIEGISEWRLQAALTLVDLCNFANELGQAGIQAVCSEWDNRL